MHILYRLIFFSPDHLVVGKTAITLADEIKRNQRAIKKINFVKRKKSRLEINLKIMQIYILKD